MNVDLKALVIADEPASGERIRRCFENHSVSCIDETDILGPHANAGRSRANLALVALEGSTEQCIRRVQQLRRAAIETIVVAGPTDDTRVVLQMIRSGADDFICGNGKLEDEIATLVNRLRTAPDHTDAPGKLIAVTGACGGTGVSTIAANVGASLASSLGNVALLDLQLVGGDQMVLLNITPRHHLIDLCQSIDTLDHVMFTQSLEHHPCGIHLLAGPPPFQYSGVQSKELTTATARLLQFATACYPATVVDLEDCVHPEQLHMAQESDVLLVVVRLDFMSLYRARHLLDHISSSPCDMSKIRIVASRAGQPGQISKGKARELLGRPVDFVIPDDPRSATMALNVGNPLVLEFPGTRIAKSIADLAKTLATACAITPKQLVASE